jgi:hypothetical protein
MIACGEKKLTPPSNPAPMFPTMFATMPKGKMLRLPLTKEAVSKDVAIHH